MPKLHKKEHKRSRSRSPIQSNRRRHDRSPSFDQRIHYETGLHTVRNDRSRDESTSHGSSRNSTSVKRYILLTLKKIRTKRLLK